MSNLDRRIEALEESHQQRFLELLADRHAIYDREREQFVAEVPVLAREIAAARATGMTLQGFLEQRAAARGETHDHQALLAQMEVTRAVIREGLSK